MPAQGPAGWLVALIVAGAPLAILAGIAFAELRGRWSRRVGASLAIVGLAATVTGVLALLSSTS